MPTGTEVVISRPRIGTTVQVTAYRGGFDDGNSRHDCFCRLSGLLACSTTREPATGLLYVFDLVQPRYIDSNQ